MENSARPPLEKHASCCRHVNHTSLELQATIQSVGNPGLRPTERTRTCRKKRTHTHTRTTYNPASSIDHCMRQSTADFFFFFYLVTTFPHSSSVRLHFLERHFWGESRTNHRSFSSPHFFFGPGATTYLAGGVSVFTPICCHHIQQQPWFPVFISCTEYHLVFRFFLLFGNVGVLGGR